MLATVFIVLIGFWLLGVFTSFTLGGFVHILLFFSIVVLIFSLLPGKKTA